MLSIFVASNKHTQPMKATHDIHASNNTCYHGHQIITTAQSLIDLFGAPTFNSPSYDNGQMEWVLDHNGKCITVYDRWFKAYKLTDKMVWNIGAFNAYVAMTASAELNRLIEQHNAK